MLVSAGNGMNVFVYGEREPIVPQEGPHMQVVAHRSSSSGGTYKTHLANVTQSFKTMVKAGNWGGFARCAFFDHVKKVLMTYFMSLAFQLLEKWGLLFTCLHFLSTILLLSFFPSDVLGECLI